MGENHKQLSGRSFYVLPNTFDFPSVLRSGCAVPTRQAESVAVGDVLESAFSSGNLIPVLLSEPECQGKGE